MDRIEIIDSHTGGEPTRVVLVGVPDLGSGNVADQARVFQQRHDHLRAAILNEPRGSDVLVGALLVEPADPTCSAGVIFFNNVGLLGMCGHGTIGLMASLAHLGRMEPGSHRIETPVGVVGATLHEDGGVSVENVASHRAAKGVTVEVEGLGRITGDVAWGGNWFFLVDRPEETLALSHVERLTDQAWRIRQAVNAQGYPEIDHIEFFGPPQSVGSQSRNFVLCPGKAYDRSPCGTGTSAKLACLAADGKLEEGQPWVQESVLGSLFTGRFRWADRVAGAVHPTISGAAYITGEATLLYDPRDPFRWGLAQPASP